jgi:peptidoglycan hydrolase-like protein with peptidoglycan-binding domain
LTAKTLLQRLGYYETPEWGISPYPDAALFKAVRAFQSAQSLAADGVIKPHGETEARLHATATRLQSLDLQSMGRNGDTLLAHITPAEAQLLDAVTDGGSINPQTGLLEFWGRMGGSKHSREQRDQADARAASLSGIAGNSDQNGSDRSQQKTYTDAQLAGAARANAEAARTREKVRSYLDRNAASKNNRITPPHRRARQSASSRANRREYRTSARNPPRNPSRPRARFGRRDARQRPKCGPKCGPECRPEHEARYGHAVKKVGLRSHGKSLRRTRHPRHAVVQTGGP